jgi:hypothetical protein
MENIQGIKWRQKISVSATPLWEISELQCAGFEPGCQFQPPYPLGYADTALWSQYVGGISENMCKENAGKTKGFRRSESVCQTQLVTVPWHPGVEWYVVYPILLSSQREISSVDVSQSVSKSVSQSVSQKKVHCILCTPLAKIFARAAKTGRRSRGFHDIYLVAAGTKRIIFFVWFILLVWQCRQWIHRFIRTMLPPNLFGVSHHFSRLLIVPTQRFCNVRSLSKINSQSAVHSFGYYLTYWGEHSKLGPKQAAECNLWTSLFEFKSAGVIRQANERVIFFILHYWWLRLDPLPPTHYISSVSNHVFQSVNILRNINRMKSYWAAVEGVQSVLTAIIDFKHSPCFQRTLFLKRNTQPVIDLSGFYPSYWGKHSIPGPNRLRNAPYEPHFLNKRPLGKPGGQQLPSVLNDKWSPRQRVSYKGCFICNARICFDGIFLTCGRIFLIFLLR